MHSLYPLRFHPIFRRYVWGGRRLGTILNKPIGSETCAESWEIVDHGVDQSIVVAGPLKGRSLGTLAADYRDALLGRETSFRTFPLLLKFLDAEHFLSVQVHPTDKQGAKLVPPDLGKTEAWIVLAAEPGSKIYAGLRPGVDRTLLERALRNGDCESCLHSFEPAVGDCVFLPAGTVHALGAGLLIAEVQQSSDTTFRLFDWNRLDANGQSRPLHIEQALDVIDWDRGPALPCQEQPTARPHVSRMVSCEKFVLDRWQLNTPEGIGGDGRFHLLMVLSGELSVAGDPSSSPLVTGESILLPAELGPTLLSPRSTAAMLLDVYLPA